MGIEEFKAINSSHSSLLKQVKTETGSSYKSDLEAYRAEKARLEAEAKEDEELLDRTITDDEKPSALDYITASLTGIAGVLSAAAPMFQGNGNVNQGAGSGGGKAGGGASASPSSKLDSAVAAFEANPKKSQREAVIGAMGDAKAALTTVNGEISNLQDQNSKLAAGDYSEVKNNLRDGLKEAVSAENSANETITSCDEKLKAVGVEKTENGAKVTANGLAQAKNKEGQSLADALKNSKETEITLADGSIVTVSQEKEGQLAELSEREAKAPQIEADIAKANRDATTAANNKTNAESSLSAEEAKPKKIEKEVSDGKGGTKKEKVDNPDRNETKIKQLKEDIKTYEKQKKDAEKLEKDKIKEQEQNNNAIADLKGKIKVGDQTLAQLEETKAKAEADKDAAVAQKDSLLTQFAGYIDEAQVLKDKGVTLSATETNVQSFGDDAKNKLVDIITSEADLSTLAVNADEATATANAQIEANNAKISDFTKQKDTLESSIDKANAALASHPDKGDVNSSYEQGKEVMINGEKCTVLSCDENGLVVKDSKGNTHNVDLSSGKPVFSDKTTKSATTTKSDADGVKPGDATGTGKPDGTVSLSEDEKTAQLQADKKDYKAKFGKEPTEAELEAWIKAGKPDPES